MAAINKLALAFIFVLAFSMLVNADFDFSVQYLNNQTYNVINNANSQVVGTITITNKIANKTFQDCDLLTCEVKFDIWAKANVSYNPALKKVFRNYFAKTKSGYPDLKVTSVLQAENVTVIVDNSWNEYVPYNETLPNGTIVKKVDVTFHSEITSVKREVWLPFNEVGQITKGMNNFRVKYSRPSPEGEYDLFSNVFDSRNLTEFAYWNTSFGYKTNITVNSLSASPITNFVGRIIVNTSGLIAQGKMNDSCRDLRVVNTSEDALLDYEIEKCNAVDTVVYFRVPSLGVGNQTYYIYYGNPVATTQENWSSLWRTAGFVTAILGKSNGTSYENGSVLIDSAGYNNMTRTGSATSCYANSLNASYGQSVRSDGTCFWEKANPVGLPVADSAGTELWLDFFRTGIGDASDNSIWSYGTGASVAGRSAAYCWATGQGCVNNYPQGSYVMHWYGQPYVGGLYKVGQWSPAYTRYDNVSKARNMWNSSYLTNNTFSGSAATSNAKLRIGEVVWSSSGEGMNGSIDEFLIANKTLTDDYILSFQRQRTYVGLEQTGTFNRVVFVNQTPSDLNSTNAYQNLVIFWNVTNVNNTQLVNLSYGVGNQSDNAYSQWFSINGTSYGGMLNKSCANSSVVNVNGITLYKCVLDDNDVYPYTSNLNLSVFEGTPHSNFSLASANTYISTRIPNVNASKQYGFFEFMATNTSSAASPLRILACNSTFAFTNPSTSPNCGEFAQVASGTPYFHNESAYSALHLLPFPIASDGTLSGVKVTATMYVIFRGGAVGSWVVESVPNMTMIATTRTTINSFTTSANQTYSVDMHVHQFDNVSGLTYYASANTTPNVTSSLSFFDSFGLTPLPPATPTILSPVADFAYQLNSNITVNWTAVTDPTNTSIRYNASMYYENGTKYATLATNVIPNNLSLALSTNGYFYISVRAIGGSGLFTDSQTDVFSVINFTVTYNATALILTTSNFSLFVSNVNGTLAVASYFVYNGVNYTSRSVMNGSYSTHSAGLTTTTAGNNLFYWVVTFTTSSGDVVLNIAPTYQTVNSVTLYQCNGTGAEYLVYYLKDEEDQTNRSGFIGTNIEYSGTPSFVGSSSASMIANNTNVLRVCSDFNTSFYVTSITVYRGNYTTKTRSHLFIKQLLTNSTLYTNLYTNVDSNTKQIEYQVIKSSSAPYVNATLKFERDYVGNGTYLTVAMSRTDENGRATTYSRPNDVYHRVTLIGTDGNIVKVFSPSIVSCDTSLTLCQIPLNTFSLTQADYWTYNGKIAYSCSYTNSTAIISCSMTDSSNMVDGARLYVYKTLALNGTAVVCDDSGSGSSVTLNCFINNTHGNTYGYSFSAIDESGREILLTASVQEFLPMMVMGGLGLFLAVLFIAVLSIVGLTVHPSLGIIMGGVGLIIMSVIGFVPLALPAQGSIIIACIILAYLMK